MNKKDYISPAITSPYIILDTVIAAYSPDGTQVGDVDPIHEPIGGEDALSKERPTWNPNGLW